MTTEIVKKTETKQKGITFRNKSLSKNSKLTYESSVKDYYKFIEDKGLEEGIDSIKKWLNTFDNPNTFNLRLQAIKEFLVKRYDGESPERRFELRELLESIKRKKPKKSVTEIDYLTIEQINELTLKVTAPISCIILAMFWTGCRVSELINIKLSDCKVNGRAVIRIRNGKGNKEREVYMPRNLYDRIREQFCGKKFLFETKEGNIYHRINITKEIKRQAIEKSGLDISAHTLRHSKAMYLKTEKKLTPDQIAKALGHSSVLTTLQHYFHGTPTAEEQGIE